MIKNRGFTLIELLVVIAIIGTLATLATAATRYAAEKAKIAKAEQNIDAVYNAIVMLSNDSNEWPGHQTPNEVSASSSVEICGPDMNGGNCSMGLGDPEAGIVNNDTLQPFPNWGGVYMTNIPIDPWGHQYFFDTNYNINADNKSCGCDGNSINCHDVVVVGSYGPDGLGVEKLVGTNHNQGCDDIIKIIAFQ